MSAFGTKRTLPIEQFQLGSLAHKHPRHRAGYERESGNGIDRGGKTKRVRNQTCGERADCVTKVSPKTVDAKGARAPRRVRCVGYCSDQSWIDHRRPDSKQQASEQPPFERAGERGEEQA